MLLAEIGFLCDKSPPTVAVLRPEIRDRFYMCKVQFLCRMIIMWFMNTFKSKTKRLNGLGVTRNHRKKMSLGQKHKNVKILSSIVGSKM
jgi:hypothetical protein